MRESAIMENPLSAQTSACPLYTNDQQTPRLPACQFCHTRKIKCDNSRPKCRPCTKHGEDCVTLSVDEFDSVARGYIGDLEEQIKEFEGQLTAMRSNEAVVISVPVTENTSNVQDRRIDTVHEISKFNKQDSTHSPNFVEGGGISFIRHLFLDSSWRENDRTLLQNLSQASGPAEAGIRPNPLPSAAVARLLFDKYLQGSHVQNPFLLRRGVQQVYHCVFSTTEKDESLVDTRGIPSHSLFRTFMILAIASVLVFRKGDHPHHPYGYFLSAMQHLDDSLLSRGLDSIQDLLLVGRFGIYHHIGISIWEITRLCMRMCIEQNLHKPPPISQKVSLLQEQLQRRVFWESYMIDRYSSITLDRPFAMADRAIQIGFPANANDDEIEAAEISGAFIDLNSFCAVSSLTAVAAVTSRTTEMSVFFACIRLRQITSKIHSTFREKKLFGHDKNPITARGAVYARLDELLSELKGWRNSTPAFDNPSCLYEMQEWYDLLYLRERLILARKALDLVPKQDNIPPKDLVVLCLHCAVGAITLFCELFRSKKITFTRSYFQMLFTGGLSIMFCLSIMKEHERETICEAIDAITHGEIALKQMGEEMPDSKRYVAVYEALRAKILRKCNRRLQEDSSTGLTECFQPNTHDSILLGAAIPSSSQRNDQFPQFHDPAFLGIPGSYAGGHDPMTQFPNTETNDSISDGTTLSWNLFNDDTLWNMEAGLNEYAYGDPPATLYSDDPFDLNMFQ